jgi:lipoprotein-releasing system permease protein
LKLSFFIARRYLVSTRKKTFINVISIISMLGVAVITAALVIVLSVFNGLGDLLHTLNNSFDPEIKIQAAKGKSFEVTPTMLSSLRAVDGVEYVTEVIEDYAYVRYREANQIITLKGVTEDFIKQGRIPAENISEGKPLLQDGEVNYAIVGQGVRYTLSIAVGDNMFPLQVYYIKDTKSTLDPSQLYSKLNIVVSGVFSIVQQFDENYVLVPLRFAQELLNYGNKRTSLEVKTKGGADASEVEARIQKMFGDSFTVLNNEEQHKDIYRLLKFEKLFTYIAFTILLTVGSINIFFSLMMLALDKKKDISILNAMGATSQTIRNIFLTEGSLIALVGTFVGLALGAVVCYLQQEFGFVSMGLANAVMQGYPVKMAIDDFALTLVTVLAITLLVSIRPAVLAARFISIQEL